MTFTKQVIGGILINVVSGVFIFILIIVIIYLGFRFIIGSEWFYNLISKIIGDTSDKVSDNIFKKVFG